MIFTLGTGGKMRSAGALLRGTLIAFEGGLCPVSMSGAIMAVIAHVDPDSGLESYTRHEIRDLVVAERQFEAGDKVFLAGELFTFLDMHYSFEGEVRLRRADGSIRHAVAWEICLAGEKALP